MTNDRIRVSDADRERVAARLRDHYAEGRLSAEEMEERISAALSAKTVGDLRRVMADLPEPEPAGMPGPAGPGGGMAAPGWRGPAWAGPGWRGPGWAGHGWGGPAMVRRGPRLLPLALVALIAAIVLPGAGWVLFAAFKIVLVVWLVTCLAGMFAAARFARRARRHWREGGGPYRHQHRWDV